MPSQVNRAERLQILCASPRVCIHGVLIQGMCARPTQHATPLGPGQRQGAQAGKVLQDKNEEASNEGVLRGPCLVLNKQGYKYLTCVVNRNYPACNPTHRPPRMP